MKNEEVKEKKSTSKKNTNTTKKTSAPKSTTNKTQSTNKSAPKKENVKKEEIIKDKVLKIENEVIEEKREEVKTTSTSKKKINSNDIILILGLVIVFVLGCFVMKPEKVEPTYELPLVLSGEAGLHQLTYAEYQEKIDNDESFVLIIERATCSYCIQFMPVAENFAKDNNVPIYYVDTDTFSSEDWEGFEKSNTFLKKNSGKWGTPTTVVLAGKDAVDSIEGATTTDALLKLYNEYFEMPQE